MLVRSRANVAGADRAAKYRRERESHAFAGLVVLAIEG
jgi:hypothetical protein